MSFRPFADSRFTTTTEGRIPHLEIATSHGVIRAPVKLDFSGSQPKPKVVKNPRHGGDCVAYALPGGLEYLA
jgi:hypothetical protein